MKSIGARIPRPYPDLEPRHDVLLAADPYTVP